MEKAAIYLRISRDFTGEHEAWERQEPICRAVAARKGWQVVKVYRDEASASKRRVVRPGYQQMRADWAAGEFEKVVVYDLDRFTRQGLELEQWILDAGEQRRPLTIASDNGDFDLLQDGGQLFARLKAAVAAAETSRKAQRQKDAAQQRAHLGRPPAGTRAFGYTKDGSAIVPEEAELVRWIFEQFLAGLSLRAISRELDTRGVQTRRAKAWHPSSVRTILTNPRYAGRTWYLGQPLPDVVPIWPAIIDGDTFDAAQGILADPSRRTHNGTAKRHLGSGLYLCEECRQAVTFTGQVYYCPGHLARKREPVDELVEAVMLDRLGRSDVLEVLADGPDNKERLADLRQEVATLLARKQKWEAERFDDLLTASEFRRLTDRADARIAELHREQAKLVAPSAASLLLGTDPAARWNAASVDAKQTILRAFCTVVLRHTGRQGPKQRARFDPRSIIFEWH